MRYLFLLYLLVLCSLPALAQESLFDALHARGDSVVIRIDTDWKQLLQRKAKKEYQPVIVSISGLKRDFTFNGKIRSRGNIRLQACNNPSLKVKLKKKELIAAGFSDLNDLKFVLQCSSGKVGNNYLVLEKLVYDLHAIYSEHHHRVLPTLLLPTQREGLVVNSFIVEAEEQLAVRYQGKILESKRASSRGLQRQAYLNMCLFNYLVLNTDWHVFNLHNVEFVTPDGSTDIIPIPYDFDYAGFVNTSYAVPREELQISSVQVPRFLGKHITEAEMRTAAAHFQARRAAAENFLRQYPNINERDRKRLLKRMQRFYEELESEKKLLQLIR